MREPRLVEAPVFSPGHCFACGGNEGPMVDSMIDIVGEGRIYVCVRTCLPLWAGLAGFETPGQVAARVEASEVLSESLRASGEALAFERDHKIVSVSDVLALADRKATPPMVVGDREPQLAETVELCSELRADGSACTAAALPGKTYCLSHSRRYIAA